MVLHFLADNFKELVWQGRYRNSDVLILDEATSGLDEYTEQSIINLLLNDSKLTILCITHSKKLVSNFDSTIEIGSL